MIKFFPFAIALLSWLTLSSCGVSDENQGPPFDEPVPAFGEPARGSAARSATREDSALQWGELYWLERRRLLVGETERTYILARPAGQVEPLPLVIGLHADQNAASVLRQDLAMEGRAKGAAVFAYLDTLSQFGSFHHLTRSDRDAEAQFVQTLIATLSGEQQIARPDRVFLVGISGGGTVVNAIACRLGPSVLRGVGILAATLYSVGDFENLANGGVSCALPAATIIWGEDDKGAGTDFSRGEFTREQYRVTLGCSPESTPVSPAPCVTYASCTAPLRWCAIPGLGHALWWGAGEAFWSFIASRL